VRLGRIAGVAVELSWTVVLIVGLLAWSLAAYTLPESVPHQPTAAYWAAGVLAALGLMASILAHELGHALVAKQAGVQVEEITLWLFGGIARFGQRAGDAASELEIALAGPAMSAAVGAACLAVAGTAAVFGAPGLVTASLAWVGVLNIVILVFNLLPGAPLDGGRVLAAILWRRSGDEMSARKRAAQAGRILGQVLVALGVFELLAGLGAGGLWLALIGWYLAGSARAEEAYAELSLTFKGVRVRDVMSTEVRSVDGGRPVADFVQRDVASVRGSWFPVVDADGALEGVVTLRRLRDVPQSEWSTTALRDVAVPIEATVRPDELLTDALGRAGAKDGHLFVVDGRRLVGIVAPGDVAAAGERLALAHQHGEPSAPARPSAVG
jgi:Zn-dependent protease